MVLMGALCALLASGVWLYCLVDILVTSRVGCRRLPKPAWLAIVALTFTIGAMAWLLFGRPRAERPCRPRRLTRPFGRAGFDPGPALARRRHPAGRARPVGPDDDPDFLRRLDQMIRGGHEGGTES